MRMNNVIKIEILFVAGILLAGCAKQTPDKERFSGFIKNYTTLEEVNTPSGQHVLRWVEPGLKLENYENIKYEPIKYYPDKKSSVTVNKETLNKILSYADNKIKSALASHKPLTLFPGEKTLIFRGAVTSINSEMKGYQIYEMIPIGLVIATTQMASGHRTMNTNMYFEGELIDYKTNKTVARIVRKDSGDTLKNESTHITKETIKQAIDNISYDIIKFNPNKTPDKN